MPSTITYRILRSWMSRTSSRVEIPSRRAASDALRGSADIGASLRVVEPQSKAQQPDLPLNGDDQRQPISVDQGITRVLKVCKQCQSLVEGQVDATWRLWRIHADHRRREL